MMLDFAAVFGGIGKWLHDTSILLKVIKTRTI